MTSEEFRLKININVKHSGLYGGNADSHDDVLHPRKRESRFDAPFARPSI